MTLDEAQIIFKKWQQYQEIADKMGTIFLTVPESFLPYPEDVLEEALNIIAKSYFDSGNKEVANNIQESMGRYLTGYYLPAGKGLEITGDKLSEEEVLRKMKEELDFMFQHPELLEAKIENLKRSRDSWAEFKKINR